MNYTYKRLAFATVISTVASFPCVLHGAFTVRFDVTMDVEIGGAITRYSAGSTFTPTASPYVYKMRPALGDGVKTYYILGSDGIGRFPMHLHDEDNWVRVALSGDSDVTLTAYKVSTVYYADAENGNDDYDGTVATHEAGSNHGPKRTLQSAHDDAANGSGSLGYPLVFVAPGVYSNGVATTYDSSDTNHDHPCNRRLHVTKAIGFVATGGAERTFIVGAPDPGTHGVGPNAVSGVHMACSGYNLLCGFTITGCFAPSSQQKSNQRGTAVYCDSARVHVVDCVISNNVAAEYPVSFSGTIQRTRILENRTTTSYLFYGGSFASCVFAGNRFGSNSTGMNSALGNRGALYFCTVDLRNVDNPQGRKRLDHQEDGSFYGVLVYGLTDKTTITASLWHESLACDNPVFADADIQDYRIGMLSPAIDAASYADGLNDSARKFMTADIDGRLPVLHNGSMRIGAYWNEQPLPVTVIVGDGGGVSVVGGGEGTNVVSSADEVTVTATGVATRPLAGFEVNGEMVVVPGLSYSFMPSTEAGDVTTVKAVYSNVWYVAQNGGDDANDGGSPTRAKATIKAATALAVSNDVIRVAPGIYGVGEGVQTITSSYLVKTRVLVPDYVTLESTGGAANTFIVGASATGGQIDNATYGTGTNAARCVHARKGAVVRGFTLTGGRCIGAGDDSKGVDDRASAFYSPSARPATIEDCIVSNNVSWLGAIYQAIVRRCRVTGNVGLSVNGGTGAAGYSCRWYGSVIDGNKGAATVRDPAWIESCTIGADNTTLAGSADLQVVACGVGKPPIVNTAILGGQLYRYLDRNVYCTNCLIASTHSSWTGLPAELRYNTILTNSTGAVVDECFRPVLGSFAGIDHGDATYSAGTLGDVDVYGTPRILNGAIDIGAVEYDWRPRFARELGRRFAVLHASPSVTTNAVGGLLVTDGEISGKFGLVGKYELAFSLTGGSLAVYVGDELVGEKSGAGDYLISFAVPDTTVGVRFAFTPDPSDFGVAVLEKIVLDRGFVLIYK